MTDIFTIVMISLGFLATFWFGMFIEWIRHTRRLNKGPYDGTLLFGEGKACLSMNLDLDELKKCRCFVIEAKYTEGEVFEDETTEKDLIHM